MLVPGRGLRRAASEELMRRPDPIGWRLRAEIAGGDGMVEVVTGAEAGNTGRMVEIDGKSATQSALGSLIRMVWLTPAMDRLWLEGAGERRRFLDRITLGFEPAHGDAAIRYEKAMRERNRLLKDGPGDPSWLGSLEAQMGREGARIARARAQALARLETAQNQAETLFPKAEMAILGDMEARFAEVIRSSGIDSEELDALESEEAAGLCANLGVGRIRDAAAGRSLSGPHRSDLEAIYAVKSMPARACSTGEQKALLISLILANARALAEAGTVPVVLLDEVAAHLDSTRRAALYNEIHALGSQAWMTGTGPELFEDLPADTMRLAVTDTASGSRLGAA